MGKIEQILRVKEPVIHTFVPLRQSPEATEDYAVKKVVQTQELTLSDGSAPGYVMNDANGVLTGGNAGGAGCAWGDITGSVSDQTDIRTEINKRVSSTSFNTASTNFNTHISSAAIHFTKASISHTVLADKGTNTHAQLDTHVASSAIHFTKASIDHTGITNIGTNTHAQVDTHIASSAIHFTKASITSLVANCEAADHGTNTTDMIINVCYGTSSIPPTATNTTIGSLYIQYTD